MLSGPKYRTDDLDKSTKVINHVNGSFNGGDYEIYTKSSEKKTQKKSHLVV